MTMRRTAISTSPSSPTHVTIRSSAGHSILRLVRGSQCPTEKSNGAAAIQPGTALSSSALVVTFFVTCRPGEDRFSSAHAAHSQFYWSKPLLFIALLRPSDTLKCPLWTEGAHQPT